MAKNLWKFEPREKQSAEPFRSSEANEEIPKPQSVGTILRERREERGEDLRYVAQMLRIRYPYLKAIEDGLVEELPGPTYAIGFVRTYAEHLGLDARDLVTRFKAEVEGLNARNDLNFPAPIPEGKIPSGAILLVGIVIAALIYAVWIYASSKDEAVSEMATQSPTNVAAATQEPAAAMETPAATDKSGPLSQGGAGPAAESVKPMPKAAAKPAGEPEASQPSAASAPADPSATPEVPEKTVEAAPVPETPVTAPEPRTEETVAAVSPPAPPANVSTESEASASEQPGTSTEPDAAATPVDAGKVYGEANADARIVLHAMADSWVEVRDKATDELLLTRVLFRGDSFRVPNRAGLTLLTGNAGGLRITVDGETVPPIGAIGTVRRDVTLDPDQLKSGMRRVRASDQSATTGPAGTSGR